jgi:glycosyltransferase involved in cell wall biosynthesis
MISVAIFTLNEEANLPHCLESLKSCDDVVVIDSFSSDQTCEIARKAGASVFQHEFSGFGDQRMWAFQNIPFKHPWVLVLDADERVTPDLWKEMLDKIPNLSSDVVAFRLKRRFFWDGKWLRYANLYPSWVVRLIRLGKVRYVNRGHAETQEIDGREEELSEDLIDENHKGFRDWIERQRRYAEHEAQYEARICERFRFTDIASSNPLIRRNALKSLGRRLPLRGLNYFLYSYLWRQGWRDGKAGFEFCFEKAKIQSLIARRSSEIRLNCQKV